MALVGSDVLTEKYESGNAENHIHAVRYTSNILSGSKSKCVLSALLLGFLSPGLLYGIVKTQG